MKLKNKKKIYAVLSTLSVAFIGVGVYLALQSHPVAPGETPVPQAGREANLSQKDVDPFYLMSQKLEQKVEDARYLGRDLTDDVSYENEPDEVPFPQAARQANRSQNDESLDLMSRKLDRKVQEGQYLEKKERRMSPPLTSNDLSESPRIKPLY